MRVCQAVRRVQVVLLCCQTVVLLLILAHATDTENVTRCGVGVIMVFTAAVCVCGFIHIVISEKVCVCPDCVCALREYRRVYAFG